MRTAARQLDISESTFGIWVRDGLLPGPEPGFPASNRRWRWATIEAWVSGNRNVKPATELQLHLDTPPRKPRGPRPGAPNAGRPSKLTADESIFRDAASADDVFRDAMTADEVFQDAPTIDDVMNDLRMMKRR
jgi:hypothetical protein